MRRIEGFDVSHNILFINAVLLFQLLLLQSPTNDDDNLSNGDFSDDEPSGTHRGVNSRQNKDNGQAIDSQESLEICKSSVDDLNLPPASTTTVLPHTPPTLSTPWVTYNPKLFKLAQMG